MQRTRAAVLDGAVRAVEKHGARRTTMADIAMLAGVAKGTLYNHFRTKEAVYSATAEAELRSLGAECGVVADRRRRVHRRADHAEVAGRRREGI